MLLPIIQFTQHMGFLWLGLSHDWYITLFLKLCFCRLAIEFLDHICWERQSSFCTVGRRIKVYSSKPAIYYMLSNLISEAMTLVIIMRLSKFTVCVLEFRVYQILVEYDVGVRDGTFLLDWGIRGIIIIVLKLYNLPWCYLVSASCNISLCNVHCNLTGSSPENITSFMSLITLFSRMADL